MSHEEKKIGKFGQGLALSVRPADTTRKDTGPDDHYYVDSDSGNWKALSFSFNIRHLFYRPLKQPTWGLEVMA